MTEKYKIDSRALDSLEGYVNKLIEKNAKLQLIRLDLAHKKPDNGSSDLHQLKQDVTHLLANRRNKPSLFGDLEGYVVKYEHGEERGPHAHAIFMFDGQKLSKDEHRGDQIGEYWAEVITKGNGVFHNVNRYKDRFERCGIGMIDHKDAERRKALIEDVLPYFAKVDQSIAGIKGRSKERAFTRGSLPKPMSKVGRPRAVDEEAATSISVGLTEKEA